jgi:hypothetical protein
MQRNLKQYAENHETPSGTKIINNLLRYIFYKRALAITKKYALLLIHSISFLKVMN